MKLKVKELSEWLSQFREEDEVTIEYSIQWGILMAVIRLEEGQIATFRKSDEE